MWRFLALSVLLASLVAACGDDDTGTNNNNNNGNSAGVCGDGHVDTDEQCDDGAQNSDTVPDACRSNCRLPRCGDGQLDTDESCDGADLDQEDCLSLGLDGGSLSCDASCMFVLTGCSGCGNTIKEADEECDTEDVGTQTCDTETTFQEGNLACTDGCLLDTSGCHTCGNSTVEGPEECDGSVPGSATCTTEASHSEGQLSCGDDCMYDTSDCSTCGDAVVEGQEACDGTQVTGSCSTVTSGTLPHGTLGCLSDCSAPDTSRCNNCGNTTIEGDEVCDGANIASATCSALTGGTFPEGTPTCAGDCYSVLTTGCHECGNGLCELDGGETTTTCPEDCAWIAVAAGSGSTCGIKVDGSLWCWGDTADNRLPLDPAAADINGDYVTPTLVTGLTDVTEVAMRHHSGCVIAGGQVYCWGLMGIDHTPTAVGSHSDPTHITVGEGFACVLDGGTAQCWGEGSSGQLGHGSFLDSTGPVTVSQLEATSSYINIAAGAAHVCAVENYTSSGTITLFSRRVLCWGANGYGQLGNDYDTSHSEPVATGLGGVLGIGNPLPQVDLWMGGNHVVANRTDQAWAGGSYRLKVWGMNNTGQVGDGSTTEYHVPTNRNSIDLYTNGHGSYVHTCAVTSYNAVKCHGGNSSKQLGVDCQAVGPSSSLGPQLVLGASAATAVTVGSSHSCALTTVGRLQCWGANNSGQTGTSTTTSISVCPAETVLDPYDP